MLRPPVGRTVSFQHEQQIVFFFESNTLCTFGPGCIGSHSENKGAIGTWLTMCHEVPWTWASLFMAILLHCKSVLRHACKHVGSRFNTKCVVETTSTICWSAVAFLKHKHLLLKEAVERVLNSNLHKFSQSSCIFHLRQNAATCNTPRWPPCWPWPVMSKHCHSLHAALLAAQGAQGEDGRTISSLCPKKVLQIGSPKRLMLIAMIIHYWLQILIVHD